MRSSSILKKLYRFLTIISKSIVSSEVNLWQGSVGTVSLFTSARANWLSCGLEKSGENSHSRWWVWPGKGWSPGLIEHLVNTHTVPISELGSERQERRFWFWKLYTVWLGGETDAGNKHRSRCLGSGSKIKPDIEGPSNFCQCFSPKQGALAAPRQEPKVTHLENIEPSYSIESMWCHFTHHVELVCVVPEMTGQREGEGQWIPSLSPPCIC